MAPIPLDDVDGMFIFEDIECEPAETFPDRLKDVIQNLFEIQSAVHGYLGSETQQELVRKMYTFPKADRSSRNAASSANLSLCAIFRTQLSSSLSSLSTTASTIPMHIPPDIIDYVDEGRNPDIYTREFVELVQKLNQFLKGKSEAFAGFRDVLAEEMMKSMPEMKDDITKVLEGREERENMQENGI